MQRGGGLRAEPPPDPRHTGSGPARDNTTQEPCGVCYRKLHSSKFVLATLPNNIFLCTFFFPSTFYCEKKFPTNRQKIGFHANVAPFGLAAWRKTIKLAVARTRVFNGLANANVRNAKMFFHPAISMWTMGSA